MLCGSLYFRSTRAITDVFLLISGCVVSSSAGVEKIVKSKDILRIFTRRTRSPRNMARLAHKIGQDSTGCPRFVISLAYTRHPTVLSRLRDSAEPAERR